MIRSVLLALGLLGPVAGQAAEAPVRLAADLAGWELVAVPAQAIATVCTVGTDGIIAVRGTPVSYLATTTEHRNFTLHVEWRWPAQPGNGGVLVHITGGPRDRAWPLCHQIQLKSGSAGDLLPMAGATFAEPLTSAPGTAPATKARTAPAAENAAGEWNVCDITCRDGVIEVTVNGRLLNRVTAAQPASGRIGFQLEGAPFELRQVRLSSLP